MRDPGPEMTTAMLYEALAEMGARVSEMERAVGDLESDQGMTDIRLDRIMDNSADRVDTLLNEVLQLKSMIEERR